MKPITFAHRGGAAERPENTVEAFVNAARKGASGVESDVHLSGDGVPVLTHEPTLRVGLRRRRVTELTADELARAGVPRLADLYDAVGCDLHVSLDVKADEAALPVIQVAQAVAPDSLPRLWLCSPDLDLLRKVRTAETRVRLVHSTTRGSITETLERHAATLADAQIDAFNLHRREWSLGLVTLFHRFDVAAFAWDVQEVRHVREVLRLGVDAVYSDHVDRMVATVAEFTSGDAS
ncbi:MAG: glycerophosphodiester phosphodiesterase [Actinobacteria bacterium]|nr:glycerophosphodiester phosphodiesterase [Actinomycetota bacterium]